MTKLQDGLTLVVMLLVVAVVLGLTVFEVVFAPGSDTEKALLSADLPAFGAIMLHLFQRAGTQPPS